MKKAFAFLMILCFTVSFVFCQTDTPAASNPVGWIESHYMLILSVVLGLYEVVVRYVPTIKNYSVVSLLIKIIQALVPNVSAKGGTHE